MTLLFVVRVTLTDWLCCREEEKIVFSQQNLSVSLKQINCENELAGYTL